MTRRHRLLIALGLGLATTTLLSLGHRDVGYVRDEGIYFRIVNRRLDVR